MLFFPRLFFVLCLIFFVFSFEFVVILLVACMIERCSNVEGNNFPLFFLQSEKNEENQLFRSIQIHSWSWIASIVNLLAFRFPWLFCALQSNKILLYLTLYLMSLSLSVSLFIIWIWWTQWEWSDFNGQATSRHYFDLCTYPQPATHMYSCGCIELTMIRALDAGQKCLCYKNMN